MKNNMVVHFTAALVVVFLTSNAWAGVVFTGLGFHSGASFERSLAHGVSADGSTVIGWSTNASNNTEAFRWTSAGGMVGLGHLPGGNFFSSAQGVSADGTTVVGFGRNSGGAPTEAFRWTAGGMVGLGGLPGGSGSSSARSVSADGTVVVGDSRNASGDTEAFRWTGGSMVGLGDLPGGSFISGARAVSADGATVAGQGWSTSGGEAFRWTEGDGMVGLGTLGGGASEAEGISADGTVIVGTSENGASAGYSEAFRWTVEGGMVGLGFLPLPDQDDYISSTRALDASDDGSLIVGFHEDYDIANPELYRAFVWDATNGIQDLNELVMLPDGWSLEQATGISDDGTVIVGRGINPLGNTEAWMITGFSPAGAFVPEPSTYALILTGFAGLALYRRRRQAL